MKTFLEVENKMGTMIQSPMPNNQTRPPLPITNPKINRPDNTERRRTIMPKRKFRPVTAANPPVSQVLPKPNYEILPTATRASTPWPGAGKTAGNITDDRQWLLPKGYPAIQDKNKDNDMMERLNEKYNLDCFLDSELDSESDKGEEYHYEYGYETLI